MDEINTAKKEDTLKDIWKRMQETGNLNYKVNPADITESAEDFKALSLEDKKRFLLECLDKNLLYIPVSEVDSEEYSLDAEDKRLTQEFYNKI